MTAENAGLSPPQAPAIARVESPSGGSTLITRAPMSDSNIAQYGPAITWVTSSTTMPSSDFAWDITGSSAVLTFTRPDARNALTWDMYDALERACEAADQDDGIRVLIIRGSGGAFAAGTDIAQFSSFASGADGVAYERRLDALADRLERVRVPTIAEVDGPAVGGGCLIAAVCDLRICSDRARFGVPVARTLGNCLSLANTGAAGGSRGNRPRPRLAAHRAAGGRRRGAGDRPGDEGRVRPISWRPPSGRWPTS